MRWLPSGPPISAAALLFIAVSCRLKRAETNDQDLFFPPRGGCAVRLSAQRRGAGRMQTPRKEDPGAADRRGYRHPGQYDPDGRSESGAAAPEGLLQRRIEHLAMDD